MELGMEDMDKINMGNREINKKVKLLFRLVVIKKIFVMTAVIKVSQNI
jgi:hypothetical protein